jgi:hypothetical protein
MTTPEVWNEQIVGYILAPGQRLDRWRRERQPSSAAPTSFVAPNGHDRQAFSRMTTGETKLIALQHG